MSAEWTIPSALTDFHDIEQALEGRQPAVFLDYDGTLTPIVDTPAQAVLSEEMRDTVRRLGERCPTAVVSGRAREDVRERVGLDNLFYAGTHGFEIAGPPGSGVRHQVGQEFLPIMGELHQRLREGLAEVPGLLLETKGYSLAVHYRLVEEARVAEVEGVVDGLMPDYPGLRKTRGKKVFEIRPRFDWNKGKAVEWLLETLGAHSRAALSRRRHHRRGRLRGRGRQGLGDPRGRRAQTDRGGLPAERPRGSGTVPSAPGPDHP